MKKRGRPKKNDDNTKWLRTLYSSKKGKPGGFKNITSDEFVNWFDQDKYDRGCFYCGLKAEDSKIIFDSQNLYKIRYDATRKGKRMRKLELERKDPSKSYDDLKNLEWACYWCNNAKSDFFSESEFSMISRTIGKTLQKIVLSIKNKLRE